MAGKSRLGSLSILTLMHVVTDGYAVFVPALWIPLKETFGLTAVGTGVVIMVGLIPANLLQPVFGLLCDRYESKWMVVLGPLVAVVLLSLLGLSNWLWLTLAMLFLANAGVALFHPEAATMAGRFAAAGSPRTMSLFLAGGFIGQAIGPTFISWAIAEDLGRTFADSWITIFPGLVVMAIGAVMVLMLPKSHHPPRPQQRASFAQLLRGRHRAIWALVATNTTRFFGLNMILLTLPEYMNDLGLGQLDVGIWMTAFIWAQGATMFIGASITPAHRERSLLIGSLAATLIPAWIFPFVDNWAALIVLMFIGANIAWTIPVVVRLGQEIVPDGQRLISGMMIGLTWGMAILVAPPLVGYLCEAHSPKASFIVGAAALIAPLCSALLLPSQSRLDELKGRAPHGAAQT